MIRETNRDEALLKLVYDALESKKAENITVYALEENRGIADYFVIATGHVSAHLRALIESVRMALKEAGRPQPRVDRCLDSGWLVLDAHDIVIHVFTPEDREFYDLDGLWVQHAEQIKNLKTV